ncbi:MAG: Uncharacterised protein [Flavobacteriales bacterium UBA4585]|nr:MAG: Uncharacterised protein [Flavobacteriales bacterium UBA4585]
MLTKPKGFVHLPSPFEKSKKGNEIRDCKGNFTKRKSFKLFLGKCCEFKKRLYICRPNREKGTLKKKEVLYILV